MSPDQAAAHAVTPSTSNREAPRLDETIVSAAHRLEAAGVAFGHGTDNSVDEAAWLVLHAVGLSPAVAPDYARRLERAEVRAVDALLRRRIEERVPTAYLTGRAWFAGHELLCDSRALVPRSPLAELIVAGLPGLVADDRAVRVLDLCTGGGCIAIACAHALPLATVDASDLSADALVLAAENVRLHALEDRVSLLHGSLYEPVRGPYELILSNPPYVDAADLAAMPAEYLREPPMGLGAGDDGLDLAHRILAGAAAVLAPGGALVVEVGNSAEALARAYDDLDLDWLDFENGGDGVFVTRREALVARFGEVVGQDAREPGHRRPDPEDQRPDRTKKNGRPRGPAEGESGWVPGAHPARPDR